MLMEIRLEMAIGLLFSVVLSETRLKGCPKLASTVTQNVLRLVVIVS